MIKYVDKETLDSLTRSDLDLLASLGIKLEIFKEKKHSERRPKAPDEYILQYHVKCRTCKAVNDHIFFMEKQGNALCARELTSIEDLNELKEDLKVRTVRYSTNVCPKCKKRLSLLSKEDIINRLLKTLSQKGEKSW